MILKKLHLRICLIAIILWTTKSACGGLIQDALDNTATNSTGNITITIKNIDGTSTPLPGSNGLANLYNLNYSQLLSTYNTNSDGAVTFSSQAYGNYKIEAWHSPNPATIFGNEFWGATVVNLNSSKASVSFMRNMPYSILTKVYVNSTNVEVTGSNVTAGTELRIEQTITNPNIANFNVEGRIVLSRDKNGNYDFDQTSPSTTANANGIVIRTFYFTPSDTGSYYCADGTMTNVSGSSYKVTNGTYWFIEPLFEVEGKGRDTINFSGITWKIRNNFGGPDSNYWSNSYKNIFVDANGELHLKIRKINGVWNCSEIDAEKSYGYGEYTLMSDCRLDLLDKNTVFGFFTYQSNGVNSTSQENEIDIEYSQWGNKEKNNRGSYVFQYRLSNSSNAINLIKPYTFKIIQNGSEITSKFNWSPNRIEFQTYSGFYKTIPPTENFIAKYTFDDSRIPVAENEKLIINFYLFSSKELDNLQEAEVIIKAVYFTSGTKVITQ